MRREALDIFAGTLASDDKFAQQFLSNPERTVNSFQPPLAQEEQDCLVEAVSALPPERANEPLDAKLAFVASYTIYCLGE